MRLVKPSVVYLDGTENPLQKIEAAARTCYKSENKITEDSAEKFVSKLLDRGHEAMIEHAYASYKFVCDRGVSHEIVRHRLFSYAQESTRYCNYSGGVEFILPEWIAQPIGIYTNNTGGNWYVNHTVPDEEIPEGEGNCVAFLSEPENKWALQMFWSEKTYKSLLKDNWTPQQARSVLPNSLKTEIVVTGNLREWRHFFKLRTAPTAHPQMREVASMVLADAKRKVPVLFDEYEENYP